jgi:AcrR family transcriptional regulator
VPRPKGANRGQITGQAVYDSAVDLMFERGYAGTSLRDVAQRVGLQMSSLYHYYPSKQALIVEIMHTTMRDLLAAVREAIDAETAPRRRLVAAIRAHIMFHATRRKENFIADSEIRALEPENRARIVELRDEYEGLFNTILDEGRSQGAFGVDDVRIATRALLSMTNGVATWYQPGGRLELDEIADQYCTIFLNGIATGRRMPVRSSRLRAAG